MKNIIDQITNIENLYWAWEKAKYFYKPGDIWFNEIEVAKFEANLDTELNLIKKQIETGNYAISPIRPMAFPKSTAPDSMPRTRQTFWISVRDQVAWLAVMNIIGWRLDYQMPDWSYGNRLYYSVFYKPNDKTGKKDLKFGWYRNTSKHTYRKWNQSWPLYRRHIAIVAKIMTKQNKFKRNIDNFTNELEDDKEREILEQNEKLPRHLKVRYLQRQYWSRKLTGTVFWAGFDLEQFYSHTNLEAILSNYKKFFPSNERSNALENLLSNLLKFPIDITGWDKKDLEAIGLGTKNKYINGIPTGLFVAGFLANVALLEVDNIVSRRLNRQKNLAHFKFVDDYVILSDNYNDLLNWIFWYEKILKKCKTGAVINVDKIEPEELKTFIEKRKDENVKKTNIHKIHPSDEIKDYYKIARKKTKLDPNFLSPLMTQTLAKVSQIAQTDFELLDEEEENKFLSDVEHLLVTDFPDQELRRDTRISFAASILSRVAPKKQINITELYNVEEQINKLEKKKADKVKKIEEYKKTSKAYRTLKKDIKQIQDKIKDKTLDKNKIKLQLEKRERFLRKHTIELLLKAIKEHHEKRKLWARLIQYYRKSGEQEFHPILALIKELKKSKVTNELNAEFILSLILHVLSDQLIMSYNILQKQDSPYFQKERTNKFLKGVINQKFLDKIIPEKHALIKFYHKDSADLFKFTLGSILYLLMVEKNSGDLLKIEDYHQLVKKYGLIDWFKNPNKFISHTEYSLACWAWWVIQKTSDRLSNIPSLIWIKAVSQLSTDRTVDLAVTALYPKKLTLKIFKKLQTSTKARKYFRQEGWTYDVLTGLKIYSALISHVKNERIKKVFKAIKEEKGFMTIHDWTKWANDRVYNILDDILKNELSIFDPRLSEWTALEITKQIAEQLKDKIHNVRITSPSSLLSERESPYYKIHCSNYLIPKSWCDEPSSSEDSILSWERWKLITRKDRVKIRNKKNLISDSRYTPVIMNEFNRPDEQLSIIHGLGVILLGLLIKDFNFPPYWNPIGLQKAWVGLARGKLRSYPISSRTGLIIESCFSKRNRETKYAKHYQGDLKRDDDTGIDPPDIFSIMEFILHIKKAQKILEKYQLTVQEHKARQLIPCSFIQLTKECDPYQDIESE